MLLFLYEVIVPELFAKKNIKIERTCEELLEDIMTLDDLKLVVKKGAD